MQANLLQLIQGWSLSLCSWRHQYSTSVLLNLQWTCLKRLFQSPSFISWFKLNIHCTYFPNPIFKCHLILGINFKYCKTDRISWAACSVLRIKTSNWWSTLVTLPAAEGSCTQNDLYLRANQLRFCLALEREWKKKILPNKETRFHPNFSVAFYVTWQPQFLHGHEDSCPSASSKMRGDWWSIVTQYRALA